MCHQMRAIFPHRLAHQFFCTTSIEKIVFYFLSNRTFDSVAPETGNFGGGFGGRNWVGILVAGRSEGWVMGRDSGV